MPTKEEFTELFRDRTVTIALIVMFLLAVAMLIVAVLGFHYSDVQLPIRYSDFGTTNTYRDKWYYLLSFPLLTIVIVGLHPLIAARLLPKHRLVTIGFLILSSMTLLYGIVVTSAVLNLVRISL